MMEPVVAFYEENKFRLPDIFRSADRHEVSHELIAAGMAKVYSRIHDEGEKIKRIDLYWEALTEAMRLNGEQDPRIKEVIEAAQTIRILQTENKQLKSNMWGTL